MIEYQAVRLLRELIEADNDQGYETGLYEQKIEDIRTFLEKPPLYGRLVGSDEWNGQTTRVYIAYTATKEERPLIDWRNDPATAELLKAVSYHGMYEISGDFYYSSTDVTQVVVIARTIREPVRLAESR